jgi:O-acetyl-ADP-ribose deacetylase (regulator of RNase III)
MEWRKSFQIGNFVHTLAIIQGDITEMDTDAIVNAANSQLILGAGVAGAIRRKGGSSIQAECDLIGGTHVGGAVITKGGNLRAKYVIHAVGPIWGENADDISVKLLADAVLNSLKVLEQHDLHSISFPAISTGIFGFPKDLAAKTMIESVFAYLKSANSGIQINFVLFSQEDLETFIQTAKSLPLSE